MDEWMDEWMNSEVHVNTSDPIIYLIIIIYNYLPLSAFSDFYSQT